MARLLETLDRKPGDRCCDPQSRPTASFAQAERIATDFEILSHPSDCSSSMCCSAMRTVCVCDLEAAVPVKQPTVSHHLRLLREAGLVEAEKVGIWAYYRIDREKFAALRERIASRLAVTA
jgi:ArsR family transcriptional regulator